MTLTLRRLSTAQAQALLAGDLAALESLVPAPGWPGPNSLPGIRMSLGDGSSEQSDALLAVLDDVIVGECGRKGPPDPDGVVEIGYGLAPGFRGQGLGTQLVRLLTAWALEQPATTRVVAEVLEENLPSRRALERNGYVLTHTDEPYVWYAFPP